MSPSREALEAARGMFPTQPEVLALAFAVAIDAFAERRVTEALRQVCCGDAACYNESSGVPCAAKKLLESGSQLATARTEGYRAGQIAMRERAKKVADELGFYAASVRIGAFDIEDPS